LNSVFFVEANGEGWMQILVFLLIVAIYGLGALLKSKANKLEEGKEKETPPETPQKGKQRARGLKEYISNMQQQAEKAIKPLTAETKQPARKKPAAYPSKRGYQEKAQKPLVPYKKLQVPSLGESIDLEEVTVEKARPKAAEPVYKSVMSEDSILAELFDDFRQTDELRKAILHYEILGKPLSLRKRADDIF